MRLRRLTHISVKVESIRTRFLDIYIKDITTPHNLALFVVQEIMLDYVKVEREKREVRVKRIHCFHFGNEGKLDYWKLI
jgi:hypothetical protein